MAEEDNEKKDLSDLAKEEITKATISQSIGTVIYPVTKEIAQLEEAGIKKLKEFICNRNKRKLGKECKKVVDEALAKAEIEPEKLVIVEKLHDAFEKASNHDLENHEELLSLWSALIEKISKNDPSSDLLVEKLSSLKPLEAKFLLNFEKHKRQRIYVNSFLRSLYIGNERDLETLEHEQTAINLAEKGLVYQPFSVQRALILILMPIALFLVSIEGMRSVLQGMDVNPSSANNVILVAIFGVAFGLAMVTRLKHPIRLTWVGAKLLKGAIHAINKKNT